MLRYDHMIETSLEGIEHLCKEMEKKNTLSLVYAFNFLCVSQSSELEYSSWRQMKNES